MLQVLQRECAPLLNTLLQRMAKAYLSLRSARHVLEELCIFVAAKPNLTRLLLLLFSLPRFNSQSNILQLSMLPLHYAYFARA